MEESTSSRLYKMAAYSLSLPERLLRTSLAMSSGLVKELANSLVPQSLQQTKLYQACIEQPNRFIIEQLAQVDGIYDDEEPAAAGDFAQRKALGNIIEGGSLLTLHLSPLLFLAAASDSIAGGKVVFRELMKDLQQQEIISDHAMIENFEQLLGALQDFTSELADHADLPPLSVDELKSIGGDLKLRVTNLQKQQLLQLDDVQELMQQLRSASQLQKRSLWEVSSAIAQNSAVVLVKTTQGAVSGAQTGVRLIDEHLVQHYVEQIYMMGEIGYMNYAKERSLPYCRAMVKAWDSKEYTWTESILNDISQQGLK
ncbi:MAG: hypothetical protein HRU15_14120 [Planctomycetes bacterium]|nr:hypothetical protein [Planctomycetota bacterium]